MIRVMFTLTNHSIKVSIYTIVVIRYERSVIILRQVMNLNYTSTDVLNDEFVFQSVIVFPIL